MVMYVNPTHPSEITTMELLKYDQSNFVQPRNPPTRKRNNKEASVEETPTLTSSQDGRRETVEFELDLSEMVVPPYETKFRNPCWYTKVMNSTPPTLHCLPSMFLIGFPKSATTDLHARLIAHPLIVPPFLKETQFLTRKFFTQRHECEKGYYDYAQTDCTLYTYTHNYFDKSAQVISRSSSKTDTDSYIKNARSTNLFKSTHRKYMEMFPNDTDRILKEGRKLHEYPAITVDSSASTAWDNTAWKHIEENRGLRVPKTLIADWLAKIYPGMKILMILREPVARTFSDYVFMRRGKASIEEFHSVVLKFVNEFKGCMKQNSDEFYCIMQWESSSLHSKVRFRMEISMYHVFVSQWLLRFPREQVMIVRNEDYRNNMSQVLAGIYRFLELPPVSQEGMEYITKMKDSNVFRYKYKLEMWPETKKIITDFFKPLNRRLAKVLKDNKFLWKGVPK